jgi:Dyp-type peroxidase family
MLQEGIYWDAGSRPGSAWGIAFLRVKAGVNAAKIDEALTGFSKIFTGLRYGRIADLPGVDLPQSGLSILIGYGPKVFAVPGTVRKRPAGIDAKFQFASPNAAGGGIVLPGSGLFYAEGLVRNPATEEIVIQAIADTSLAVARVFVEIQKYLSDHPEQSTGVSPIEFSAGFTGFNRDDGRSWIDFHDGISNLISGSERKGAIEIKKAGTSINDRWTVGGTYLTFMRLTVDLRRWRAMSVLEQELAVGRSKINGCPISSLDPSGLPIPVTSCPFINTASITEPGNTQFFEPPQVADARLLKSHVQRANHHIGPPDRDVSQRIFRQGYEFFEPPEPGRPMEIGLNFVSFQDSLSRIIKILTLDGWLGNTNFGGEGDSLNKPLLHALGAGVFLCPPLVNGEAYPGQSIFVS